MSRQFTAQAIDGGIATQLNLRHRQRLIQLLNHLLAKFPEHAQRNHWAADDFCVQRIQVVNGSAQPRKLFMQDFLRDRMALSQLQSIFRLNQTRTTVGCTAFNLQRLPDFGTHFNMHGDSTLRIGHIERTAKLLIQARIIGLPNLLPNIQLAEIQMTAIKGQIDFAIVHRFVQSLSATEHLEDSSTLLVAAESVAIEHDSVTSLYGIFQTDRHTIAKHIGNPPQQHASLGGTCCRNQHLMVAAVQPAW